MRRRGTDPPRVLPAGDAAALVVLADEIDPAVNTRVHALASAVVNSPPPGFRDAVAGYSSLLVSFDPITTDFDEVSATLLGIVARAPAHRPRSPRRIEIPTLYGGEQGPDLGEVASRHGLTPEEVIGLHSRASYTVYMIGFAPGQPYLGRLPARLTMPRLATPRAMVRQGSVAIADQTTIYSTTGPGGWWLVGRTPVPLFDPSADPPTLLQAGDRVRFVPIALERYRELGGD